MTPEEAAHDLYMHLESMWGSPLYAWYAVAHTNNENDKRLIVYHNPKNYPKLTITEWKDYTITSRPMEQPVIRAC